MRPGTGSIGISLRGRHRKGAGRVTGGLAECCVHKRIAHACNKWLGGSCSCCLAAAACPATWSIQPVKRAHLTAARAPARSGENTSSFSATRMAPMASAVPPKALSTLHSPRPMVSDAGWRDAYSDAVMHLLASGSLQLLYGTLLRGFWGLLLLRGQDRRDRPRQRCARLLLAGYWPRLC
jgi:hypothetical protein